MTALEDVCKGVDWDLYANDPGDLPLYTAAPRILNDFVSQLSDERLRQNGFDSAFLRLLLVDILKGAGWWVLGLLTLLLLMLACSCGLNLSACSKGRRQHQVNKLLGTGCVLAILAGYRVVVSMDQAGTAVSTGFNALPCSAGLAMDGLLNGDGSHEAHGFPGVFAFRDVTVETLNGTSSLVKDLNPEVATFLIDEALSLFNYFMGKYGKSFWDKLNALVITDPFDPNDKQNVNKALGLEDHVQKLINSSLDLLRNETASFLDGYTDSFSSSLESVSKQLTQPNVTEMFSQIQGNLSKWFGENKTVLDTELSKYATNISGDERAGKAVEMIASGKLAKYVKYRTILILISFWLLIGCCLGCSFQVGGRCSKISGCCCMEGCKFLSLIAFLLLVAFVTVGAFVGVPCGILSRPTFTDVTVPTLWNTVMSTYSGSDMMKDSVLTSVLDQVIDTASGTCLAGRNNGELVSGLLGPHHNWTALLSCVTHLPYESLKHRADGADWTYSVFTKTISCLETASFVPSLLPKSDISLATFQEWWDSHNLSTPQPLAASLHAELEKRINVTDLVVSYANSSFEGFIGTSCEHVTGLHPAITKEVCASQFEKTKKQVIGNVSIIFADFSSLESFEDLLLHIAKGLPEKTQSLAKTSGAIFHLLDDKLISRINCGLVATTWTNVFDGALCSDYGFAGVITSLMKAAFFLLLSFFAAVLCFYGACIFEKKKKKKAFSRERAFYSTLDMDHDKLLQF